MTLRSTRRFPRAATRGRSSRSRAELSDHFCRTRFPGAADRHPRRRPVDIPSGAASARHRQRLASGKWTDGARRSSYTDGRSRALRIQHRCWRRFPSRASFSACLSPDIGESIILNLETQSRSAASVAAGCASAFTQSLAAGGQPLRFSDLVGSADSGDTLGPIQRRRRRNGSTCGRGLPLCCEPFCLRRSTSRTKRSRCSSSASRSCF